MTKEHGKMGFNSVFLPCFNRVSNINKKVLEAVTYIFTACIGDFFIQNIDNSWRLK